ncbi:hypothetical protein D3C76_1836860 [compost metagenome]
MPVNMEGRAEGSTTLKNRPKPEMPMDLADFTRRGSTLLTPAMVLSKTGQRAP